jgi:hypothetical protein
MTDTNYSSTPADEVDEQDLRHFIDKAEEKRRIYVNQVKEDQNRVKAAKIELQGSTGKSTAEIEEMVAQEKAAIIAQLHGESS